jgi:mannitol-1-phosphate/altronate dehydrogenase
VQDFGIDDEWPVVAEHYGQWIIEESFVNGW